jgi:hypothetical protein
MLPTRKTRTNRVSVGKKGLPGEPTPKASNESLDDKLRGECLNQRNVRSR